VTLLLAVAAAAVVVLYGEPSLAAAAAVAPSVPTLPQRPGDKPMHALQMIRELIAACTRRWPSAAAWRAVGSLRDVDDRTLADLGVARSEITSIEAESRRRTAMTRQRIVGRSAMRELAPSRVAPLLLALALTGCASAPGPSPARPAVAATELPVLAPSATARVDAGLAIDRWWTLFGDPALDRLIADALARNHDLALAAGAGARGPCPARRDAWHAGAEPRPAGAAGRSRQSADGLPSGANTIASSHSVALVGRYELDLWGASAAGSDAARQRTARRAVEPRHDRMEPHRTARRDALRAAHGAAADRDRRSDGTSRATTLDLPPPRGRPRHRHRVSTCAAPKPSSRAPR
jgi:uncharacterized protein YjiS (DUF1127 family)